MRHKSLRLKLFAFVATLACAFSANAQSVILGDVDNNGTINIADVTALIDYLLTNDASGISLANADCDGDGNIGIGDVTMVIDHLLGTVDLNPPETQTFTVNDVSFTMVTVEGGTFIMGAPDEDTEADDSEKPAHQVTLSTYSIGQTEVTQELWVAIMDDNPSYYCEENGWGNDLTRPVEWISWNKCQEFIEKLNEVTGETFRLPTEAEWEFAARGGNKSKGYIYSGSNTIDYVAWYGFCFTYGPEPVATLTPNELGLYDMTGNVCEWCQDWYGDYSSDAQINPTGPETGYYRVHRGGGFDLFNYDCRVLNRSSLGPTDAYDDIGLRLVLSAPQ